MEWKEHESVDRETWFQVLASTLHSVQPWPNIILLLTLASSFIMDNIKLWCSYNIIVIIYHTAYILETCEGLLKWPKVYSSGTWSTLTNEPCHVLHIMMMWLVGSNLTVWAGTRICTPDWQNSKPLNFPVHSFGSQLLTQGGGTQLMHGNCLI